MRGKLKDSIFNALWSQSIKYIVHSLLHKLALIRSNKEEKDFKPVAFSNMSEKKTLASDKRYQKTTYIA